MFGVQFDVTPAIDILEAATDSAIRSPAIMATSYQRGMTRLGQRSVEVLSAEPGAPPAGITRLMTPRQRRAFWATDGFGGGIPHVRTHAISEGWKYRVAALDNGGEFVIYNDVPGVNYVEGWDQQPFLAAVGWLYAPPILADVSEEADEITIQAWYTASDLYAGVPG